MTVKRNNAFGSKSKFFLLILLVFSCDQKKSNLPTTAEKVFEKPSVADHAEPPLVTLLDTCPPPQTIVIPVKTGGSYKLTTDTGARKITLLPPVSRPADFNIVMKSFNVEDGLALNSVTVSYCDTFGNLWFGTSSGGISRYDGKSFTTYTTKQGLWDNQVFSIFQDKSGAMWFGTWNGITKYDGKNFTGYRNDSTTCCIFQSMAQDKNENMWFGTQAGLSTYNGKSFKTYHRNNGLAGDAVSSILQAKNGDTWFATESGVSKYNGQQFKNFTTAHAW